MVVIVHTRRSLYSGFSALHWASSVGAASIVDLLLKHGADPDPAPGPDPVDGTRTSPPLLTAAFSGSSDAVTALLDVGADVTAATFGADGVTAVHVAAWKGDVGAVRALVQRGGAQANATAARGRGTPLQWAAWKNNLEVVRYLATVLLEDG